MARRLAEAAGKNAAPWLTFVRAPPIILLLASMYLLVLVRKKIVLRLLLSTTPYGRSSRGCWQRECCSAERPGRQGFPSSSSDRSDDHPLPVSLSWRRVVSAGPAQWAGRHGAPPGRHMFCTAHMRMSGRREAAGSAAACSHVWWTGGACCLPPFFLLLDSGKENFARDRQAGGGQELVALTEKAPRPWPPPPLPRPTAVRHKGCSYLFFSCSGTGRFWLQFLFSSSERARFWLAQSRFGYTCRCLQPALFTVKRRKRKNKSQQLTCSAFFFFFFFAQASRRSRWIWRRRRWS
jgi:hypothetical protein